MTRTACIQVVATVPKCTTGTNSDAANLTERHLSDGGKDLFGDPEHCDTRDLEILDRVHASAHQDRWMSEEQMDYDMLKHWLWICRKHHNITCTPLTLRDLASRAHPTGVIDICRGCVVSTPPHAAYVCLSYVWTTQSQIRLTTMTLDILTSEGALFDETTRIAKTIEDAIFVCGMLSFDYLWVDSILHKSG